MQCGLCGRWTGTLQPGGCNLVLAVEKQPEEDKALQRPPLVRARARVCVCVCVQTFPVSLERLLSEEESVSGASQWQRKPSSLPVRREPALNGSGAMHSQRPTPVISTSYNPVQP